MGRIRPLRMETPVDGERGLKLKETKVGRCAGVGKHERRGSSGWYWSPVGEQGRAGLAAVRSSRSADTCSFPWGLRHL